MVLSLARIYYPVKTLGPGNRVGIWVNGCQRRCPGCISPELWEYDAGREIEITKITEWIKAIKEPKDGFTVSGGEPFDQPDGLCELVKELSLINDDILIFTGYTIEELKSMKDSRIDYIIRNCAALVDGPYVDELNDDKGLRGSSNQRIILNRYHEKYAGSEILEKKIQIVKHDTSFYMFGIPGRNKK